MDGPFAALTRSALLSAFDAGGMTAAEIGPATTAFMLLGVLVVLIPALMLGVYGLGNWFYRGQPIIGWMRIFTIPYLRYFQCVRVEGRTYIPRTIGPEGLIVVSTHGAGLDPIALTATIAHPIRWLMSVEMMAPHLGWMWRRMQVIPIAFDARDATALKTAIAHINSGQALGIFPEGGIERPSRMLRPFAGGLRLILTRTKAPVLVAMIDPGRQADSAWGSYFMRTRATIRFVALVQPGVEGHSRGTSDAIFALLQKETGWPTNFEPMDPPDPETVETNLRAYSRQE
jgi:1-acyl-sn-glycerol-3-phosphate acyltransferase